MKEIPLGGKLGAGLVALVDDEDYDRVSKYKWHLQKKNTVGYASHTAKANSKFINVLLHRFVLMALDSEMQIDHKNHNGLDCRKNNLRLCTHKQNNYNRRGKDIKSSNFKGVYWNKSFGRWQSQISINRKKIYIGRFVDEYNAAKAYDNTARELFGEFAYLNFK